MKPSANPDRGVVFATIDDALHFDEDTRRQIIESYPPHEREARTKGVPIMGSGRVFPVEESAITIDPIAIPEHWAQINGIDFGWDHPFGAVNCAWDRDADCFYVCKEYQAREETPLIHVGAVKPWGDWIPTAWPHDGLQHDKGSGEELAKTYKGHGLSMTAERATFVDGSSGVEAGIMEMLERMQTNRWKVFSTCGAWLAEFRLYHRKDGRIVKIRDDCISSSRYAYMMRRMAKTRPVKRAGLAIKPQSGGWMGR